MCLETACRRPRAIREAFTLALMHKHFHEYARDTSRQLEALIDELRVHPRLSQQGLGETREARERLASSLPRLVPFGGRRLTKIVALLDDTVQPWELLSNVYVPPTWTFAVGAPFSFFVLPEELDGPLANR